jgi:hypothetical protein
MRIPAALVMVAGLALPGASWAAEVVFPPGSRIGLAPPANMNVSQRFTGFESRGRNAVITAVEMPPEAFKDLSAGLTADNLKKQGLTMKSRETFKVVGGDAVLVEGEQGGGPAPVRKWLLVVEDPTMTAFLIGQKLSTEEEDADREMREALRTVAIREPRSLEEQLSALPFRLGDMAGFRAVRVMAGNSVLLTEGPNDTIREIEQPVLVVAQSASAPPREQRDAFARAALRSNNTLKDLTIERAQSFRQRGADWHEIVAKATDAVSGRPVVVTQTLRFAPDHYVRLLGMVRAEARDETLFRFRAVSDAVEPKDR